MNNLYLSKVMKTGLMATLLAMTLLIGGSANAGSKFTVNVCADMSGVSGSNPMVGTNSSAFLHLSTTTLNASNLAITNCSSLKSVTFSDSAADIYSHFRSGETTTAKMTINLNGISAGGVTGHCSATTPILTWTTSIASDGTRTLTPSPKNPVKVKVSSDLNSCSVE